MAGYSTSYSHRCSTFCLLLFCMLLVFLLWGCGSGTSEQESSEKVSTASTHTGSASFAVQWHTTSAVQTSAVARQAIENCETAGVASITCRVYGDESQSPIASGGPWNCSDQQGTIGQIPAGSNRVFSVLGWSDTDGGGSVIYQGQVGSVTITPGQITDAGTVDARPFVPSAPTIGDVYGNQINLSWNDLGVYGYRIYRDGAAVGDTTATTFSDTGLSPETQYCYTVSALDSFGNESGQSGQTCATTTALSIWYRDADGDTYGNPGVSTQATSPPDGYVADNTDCNDGNGAVHPGAPELLDGLDNDCDGSIDEGFSTYYRDADGDTYGDPEDSIQATSPPAGYVANNTDCNDGNGAIHPGANEICNGVDDDCDGSTDEGVQTTYYRDADSDTYGDPSRTTQACSVPSGYVTNDDDCNDGVGTIHPGANEICNGVDDDCDSDIDEGLSFSYYYADDDDDGYGDRRASIYDCEQPPGYVADATDCNDDDPDINPGEREVCYDGIDNNCDDVIDDVCADINPTSSFTARVIGGQNVLVGDANDKEGQPFNSTFLSIKEGTSDRVCLEFNITSQPVPRRVTLEFTMSNLDDPSYSYISLYHYNANGLANAEDYYHDDTSAYISTFSDYGASGTNPYAIDVTEAYLESIKRERTYMGILMKANDAVARYYVYNPILTFSY